MPLEAARTRLEMARALSERSPEVAVVEAKEEDMADNRYDAIVVGARCAGSPTAMLLARKGHKVLVVDRARFPSDTLSTHILHPPGVASLRRWGLLDRLTATGCPPIDTYSFDFGAFAIAGAPGTGDTPVAYGPRRTVLDKLLVDAASEAGAEVRERFTVEEVVVDGGRVTGIKGHGAGGRTVTEHAKVVVGADGRHSLVARAVEPEQYHEKPQLLCGYYTYWSGLPMDGRFETYVPPDRGFAAWATNDDLTVVIGGWPFAEFEANKRDVEGNYLKMLEMAPSFAERVRAATREARFAGARPFQEAMGAYQATRDAQVLPMYELTCQFATLEPPPPEMQGLLGAVHGNQEAMDGFARVMAGVTSPAEFFSEENVGRIMAQAGAGAPA